MPKGSHANSQKNLRKWTKKGGDNPAPTAGRAKNVGASIKEWMTVLNGAGEGHRPNSKRDLRKIIADDKAEPAKVAAAISLLKMRIDGELQLEHARHVLDYTDGKPKQTLQSPGGGPVFGGVTVLPPDEPPE